MSEADSPTTSLQRIEAEVRGRQLRVLQTVIALDLTEPGPTFSSKTTITFTTGDPGSATFLEFAGASLESIELNGTELESASWSAGRIPLPGLQAENTVTVRGRMAYSEDGEGLHRHVDPVDGRTYLYAMSFLNAAPRWFACFDQPDLKSAYEHLGPGPGGLDGAGKWTECSARRQVTGGSCPPRRSRPTSSRWSPVRTPRSTTSTDQRADDPARPARPCLARRSARGRRRPTCSR